MKRFQNQCFCHNNTISSMGTFFVSGRKKKMKMVMITSQPAKKRKMPYRKWHNIVRKSWAMRKVNNKFTETTRPCPAERISIGKISLGTNQPSGPHDQAKPATKMQTKETTAAVSLLERTLVPPNFNPKIMPTITYTSHNYIVK